MKPVVGLEAEMISEDMAAENQPLSRRSFHEWARQLSGCRLCRNLTMAAFVAILAIEVAILIPSYRNYEEDLLSVRVDVSDVSSELVAFVFRILGLSLLIAVFVTAVTMFVVDRMMLSPLLRLRERISRAGDDAEHPLRYLMSTGRRDEFGEVEGVFNSMLKQNASYLAKLKLLNRELDQLLDERTQTLRRTEQELEIRTLYDQLTGLANRSLFEEQVDHHFRHAHANKEAVLVLGVNDFQALNGLAGHETGDRVLQEIARRIAGFSPDHGDVARLGGDVFGLLVGEVGRTPAESIEARISAIIEACERPVQVGGKSYECEVSAEVAVTQLDGQDARTLLSHAEIAMHRAKKSPSQRVQFFASEFGEQVLHRQEMIRSLKVAIQNRQFQLYYQPQFDRLRRRTGYEALLRWHHPVIGSVSPAEFIPLAEETGLIVRIGDWVLEQAVITLKRWVDRGFRGRIAVNVSAMQLHDQGFADRISDLLRRYEVTALQLELEITETALMDDVERAMATLSRFRELGLALAVDDFGTGYSSLAGCDELQGFLLGKPGPHGFRDKADSNSLTGNIG
jgi:diguanylate cyclase (GGDEF)-like protein